MGSQRGGRSRPGGGGVAAVAGGLGDPGRRCRRGWVPGTRTHARGGRSGGGRANEPFRAGGRDYPAGTLIVDMHQPAAAFAQTLLESKPYPASFGPDGRLRKPYDVTAYALPLLLGVDVTPVYEELDISTRIVLDPAPARRMVEDLSGAVDVMVGLYQPWVPSTEEGWTRWVLETHAVPHRTLRNQRIRRGDLISDYTAIVLPGVRRDVLEHGFGRHPMPEEFSGGLGEAGARALREFVRDGGVLVAEDEGAEYPPRDHGPPRLQRGSRSRSFDVLRTGGAGGIGARRDTSGWRCRMGRWRRGIPRGRAGLRRPGHRGRALRGRADGAQRPAGGCRPTGWETRCGRDRSGQRKLVLFGFRPTYRGQAVSTFPFLFDALRAPPLETLADD